jgi:hypothetical protein
LLWYKNSIRSLPENIEAAQRAGEAIENAVNSVSLTAIQEKGLPIGVSEALVA